MVSTPAILCVFSKFVILPFHIFVSWSEILRFYRRGWNSAFSLCLSLVICSQGLPHCLHFQAQFFEWKFSKLGFIKTHYSWDLLKLFAIFRIIKDLFSLNSQYWNTVWKFSLDFQITLKLLKVLLALFAALRMCSSVGMLNFASMGSECGQKKFFLCIIKFSFEEDWRLQCFLGWAIASGNLSWSNSC